MVDLDGMLDAMPTEYAPGPALLVLEPGRGQTHAESPGRNGHRPTS